MLETWSAAFCRIDPERHKSERLSVATGWSQEPWISLLPTGNTAAWGYRRQLRSLTLAWVFQNLPGAKQISSRLLNADNLFAAAGVYLQ